jgi:hypothetical protein
MIVARAVSAAGCTLQSAAVRACGNHYVQIDQSERFVAEVDSFMRR